MTDSTPPSPTGDEDPTNPSVEAGHRHDALHRELGAPETWDFLEVCPPVTRPYGVVDAKFVADVRALLSLSEGESIDANQESGLFDGHPSRVLRGAEAVASHAGDMGHHARHPPDLVVLPLTTEEVAAVVRLCYVRRVPIVPRGAGTGLEGGCVAYRGGVVIDTCLMKRIATVDGEQLAVVGAGC